MFDGAPAEKKSPKEIARDVRKPAKLQVAEAELARLKAHRSELNTAIRRLNSLASGAVGGPSHDADLRRLDTEERQVIVAIGPVRRQVVEMRAAHGVQVRQALAPFVSRAAERARAAAEALRDAVGDIEAANVELARASAETIFLLPPDLDVLLARLGRLAGRG